jgi:hypothetical protein
MPTHSGTGPPHRRGAQRRSVIVRGLALLLGGPLLAAAAAATPSESEAHLIEAVIRSVATMSQAVFIRNGSTATPAEAAKHLRDKYAYYRGEIATAEDFIRLCGTGSALTGRAYLVRLPNGVERPAAEVLRERLETIRSGSSR